MFGNIIKIAVLCIVLGGASIPLAFGVNNSPWVVWVGNSLGSLISALVVIYVAERISDDRVHQRLKKYRISNKVITVMDEGDKNEKVVKARGFINKHGLKIFALLCPIFPGALLSTVTVYTLDLDKKTYKRWLCVGIFFVSGIYVFGYWFTIGKRL